MHVSGFIILVLAHGILFPCVLVIVFFFFLNVNDSFPLENYQNFLKSQLKV